MLNHSYEICECSIANPDHELIGEGGEGGGCVLLTLLTFLPSAISFFFAQNKGVWGGGACPLGPTLRSTTGMKFPFHMNQLEWAALRLSALRKRPITGQNVQHTSINAAGNC